MLPFVLVVTFLAAVKASPAFYEYGPRLPSGRIVGGDDAVIEDYPYQVSIEWYGSHKCGGSIISARYVVTAGHCLGDYSPPSKFTIRAGATFRNQGGRLHNVSKVIRHEKFLFDENYAPHYDIALIEMEKPFHFDDKCQPINMFETGEEAFPGMKAVITGWGHTGHGLAEQLQTVTVPIISRELCQNVYAKFGSVLYEGEICAAYYGVGGKDACEGDSGGPLTIDGRLAGIVSWGNGCAEPYYPGVYTEISVFREWIDQHAGFE